MLYAPPELWLIVFAVLGAILGSYVNMAAYRLPRGISTVTRTRSFCPRCEHDLAWYDNIPVLSYLTLLGRCRYCRRPIGLRYLWTELIVAALFTLSAYQFFVLNESLSGFRTFHNWLQPPIIFAAQLFLIVDLVLLSIVDLETWLIPLQTTIPGAVLGLLLAPLFPALHPGATTWFVTGFSTAWKTADRLNALLDSIQGLVLGAGCLWAVGFLTTLLTFAYFKLRGIPARPKEGMGAGDCHLMAMIGALLGWKAAVTTIFLGVIFGTVSGLGKILWDKFQHWRLGARWRPWQPTYELPAEEPGTGVPLRFWPLAVMGVGVLVAVAVLFELSARSFSGQLLPTLGEMHGTRPVVYHGEWGIDMRLMAVYVMGLIGVLLVLAFPFYSMLAHANLLPQGEVVENEAGAQEEIIQGNYIPFGPSLALAGLVVAFYDPLLREFAFWFFSGGAGALSMPLPYHLAGETGVRACLEHAGRAFNGLVHALIPGGESAPLG